MNLFTLKHQEGFARAGIIHTPHGEIQTPAFIPVGTQATVKTVTPQELLDTGSQAVLANTYHLYLSPGVETIREYHGFAPFMKWDGPTFTDSGGYQVAFLWTPKEAKERSSQVTITEEGAVFRSHIDGSKHLLTPEKSMEIQDVLSADIIMAFDQPLSQLSTREKQKDAFERTMRWETRSHARWTELQKTREHKQALYGVVQGETDPILRRASLDFVLRLDFPGIAIGGSTIGSDPQITADALDTIVESLPSGKPVHALGLGGGPEGIFEAVKRGVDTFDNTSVTRMARTGLLFLFPEDGGGIHNKFRSDVHKFSPTDMAPISSVCTCMTCKTFSRGYIRHLFVNNELLGGRLASIHNIHYMNTLMEAIRTAILQEKFTHLYDNWLKK